MEEREEEKTTTRMLVNPIGKVGSEFDTNRSN